MKYVDYELGGIALQDTSQGLMYQVWKLELLRDPDSGLVYVYISAPATVRTLLFSRMDITEASFAFDQNMNPFVCFMAGGVATFWWFDTVDLTQKFTDLPAGSTSPKCCLDDKRGFQLGRSDIVLGYIRSGRLFTREQHDRYLIEYDMGAVIPGELMRVGMNSGRRLMFAVGVYGEDYPVPLVPSVVRSTTAGRIRKVTSGQARRIRVM